MSLDELYEILRFSYDIPEWIDDGHGQAVEFRSCLEVLVVNAYDGGLKAGGEEGYEVGYDEGWRRGHSDGYDEGYDDRVAEEEE